jgi:hypothetical protein
VWGPTKDKEYGNNPNAQNVLKDGIQFVMLLIMPGKLGCKMNNLFVSCFFGGEGGC